MRDRVESLGGTLTVESVPGRGTRIVAGCRRPPRRRSRRAGCLTCARRVAWVLAGVTLVLAVADVVVTAQYRHLLSEDAVAEHGFPFVDGAVLGCAVMGALIISARRPAPDRLAAEPHRGHQRRCRWSPRRTRSGCCEGGPGSEQLGGVAGWLSSLLGGQLAIRRARPDVPAGAGRAAAVAPLAVAAGVIAAGELLCFARGRQPGPDRPSTSVAESDDIGPVRSGLLTLGFLLISVGAARLAGLDGAPAAPEPGRAAAAGAPDRALGGASSRSASAACSSSRRSTAASRPGPPPCRSSSPTSCCRCCSRSRCCATGSTTSR